MPRLRCGGGPTSKKATGKAQHRHCQGHLLLLQQFRNILAFQLATPRCLEPAAHIMLRRGQLMRRIIAKHPGGQETIVRILDSYKEERIMGITIG